MGVIKEMDTDFGERLDTVNQDDIGVIPKEIKDAAERRRIKHEKALQSIKEINAIYDKDGEIIESDDIVFTPDDRFFCIVFDENGKAKAHKLRGSSVPLFTYISIYEKNIYDNLSHRRWTTAEKHMYTIRSLLLLLRYSLAITCILFLLSLPSGIEVLADGIKSNLIEIGVLLFSISECGIHLLTKKLRDYNKNDQ